MGDADYKYITGCNEREINKTAGLLETGTIYPHFHMFVIVGANRYIESLKDYEIVYHTLQISKDTFSELYTATNTINEI